MRTIETPEQRHELLKECIRVTHEWVDRINKHFGLSLPHYKVEFPLKNGVAGRAYIGRDIIVFNSYLLCENPDEFLARTPGHEVMHHAAYAKHGMDIKPHGREWKAMMRAVGLPDTRCHSFDTTTVPARLGKYSNPDAKPIQRK